MDSSDQPAILEGFKKGDSDAVGTIVKHYYKPLLNFLIRMGCPPAEAEDIIQDSQLKAARGLKRSYLHRDRFRASTSGATSRIVPTVTAKTAIMTMATLCQRFIGITSSVLR